jgi:hypothetical protein
VERAHLDPLHSHNAECPVRENPIRISPPFFHSLSSQASARDFHSASLNTVLSARIEITSINVMESRAAARGRAWGCPKLAQLEAEMLNLAIRDKQFRWWKKNFLH